MKILTIIGTRPEIIRLSLIIKKLDELVEHVLVYTNQNYDYNLSGVFFKELKIREPNYYFDFQTKSFGEFLSKSILEFEIILQKEKPDKILILGDTNSGLLGIVGRKYNIPIYHMEAGNRSFDGRVPEEANRKIIDSISRYNLPYTENSKQNLLSEGYHKNCVFKIGNPIFEVLNYYNDDINNSKILDKLNLKKHIHSEPSEEVEKYVLVTVHRSENVDNETSLRIIHKSINEIALNYKVVLSLHPRTKDKLNRSNLTFSNNVIVSEPFGFFDFVNLEKNAMCVISDSGTVTEESMIFGVQSIILRESTERQELIECGSTILTGVDYNTIIRSFNNICELKDNWDKIEDYMCSNVSDKVVRLLLGKN